MKQVLFVCLGNICRSPLAEGVFNHHAVASGLAMQADSAGTANWHVGKPPHWQSAKAAKRIGISLAGQVCRQVERADFDSFDLILAMDRANLADLNSLMAGNQARAHVGLFLDYAGFGPVDVPDPWGGEDSGYDRVAKTILEATPAIAARLLA